MKGVVDIEFILSVVVFLTTVTFVTFIIITNVPLFHREALNEDLRARAYEISEFLMFDEGFPADWYKPGVDAQRLGLSGGGRYNLSAGKINKLNSMCQGQAGYENVKTLLGQDYRNDVTIEVVAPGNIRLAVCAPQALTTVRPKFQITRFAPLADKTMVKIVTGVA